MNIKPNLLLVFAGLALALTSLTLLLAPTPVNAQPLDCMYEYSTCEEIEQNGLELLICVARECADYYYWPCVEQLCGPYFYFCQHDTDVILECSNMGIARCYDDYVEYIEHEYEDYCE